MAAFYLVDGGSEECIQPRQTDRQNCACDNDLDQCRPLLALLWTVSAPFQSEATAAKCERVLVNFRIDPREFHLPQISKISARSEPVAGTEEAQPDGSGLNF